MQYMILLQLGESLLAQKDYAACLQIHPANTVALFKHALLHFNGQLVVFFSGFYHFITQYLQAHVQGVGPRGPDPPLLQLMFAFIHMY